MTDLKNLPPLPEGFVLDQPANDNALAAAPSKRELPPLPEGFTLDGVAKPAQAAADLPAEEGPGVFDQALEYGKSLVSGALNTTASMIKGQGVASARDPKMEPEEQKLFEGFNAKLADIPAMSDDEFQKWRGDAMSLITMSAHNPGLNAPNYADTIMPVIKQADLIRAGKAPAGKIDYQPRPEITDTEAYKAGKNLEQWTKEAVPVDPNVQNSLSGKMASALGSTIPFVATALTGGPLVSAISGMSASTAEAVDKAVAEGATRDQIAEVARQGMFPGATEAVPIETLLDRIPVPVAGKFLGAVGRVLEQAAIEGGQEAVQQAWQNIIAKYEYKPDQDVFEGVAESALVGSLVGGAMKAPVEAAKIVTGKKDQPVEGEQSATVEAEVPSPLQSPVTQDGGEEQVSPLASSPSSAISPTERAILRATAIPDEDIDQMSREEIVAKVAEAKAGKVSVSGDQIRAAAQYASPAAIFANPGDVASETTDARPVPPVTETDAVPAETPVDRMRREYEARKASSQQADQQAEQAVQNVSPALSAAVLRNVYEDTPRQPVPVPAPVDTTPDARAAAERMFSQYQAKNAQADQAASSVQPDLEQVVRQSISGDQQTEANVDQALGAPLRAAVLKSVYADGAKTRLAPPRVDIGEEVRQPAPQVAAEPLKTEAPATVALTPPAPPLVTPDQAAIDTAKRKSVRANEQGFPLDLKGAIKKPDSLIEFLARRGGVREATGELRSIGLTDRKTGFVVGSGPLVRARGVHPDKALEAAVQAGYLPEGSTLTDFYDAMAQDARTGRQVFAQGDMEWGKAWQDQQSGEARQAEQDAAEADPNYQPNIPTDAERERQAIYIRIMDDGYPGTLGDDFSQRVARFAMAGESFEDAVSYAHDEMLQDAASMAGMPAIPEIPFFGDETNEAFAGTTAERKPGAETGGFPGDDAGSEVETDGTVGDRTVRGEGGPEAEIGRGREDGQRSDREGESNRPAPVKAPVASWVVREKATGNGVLETFEKRTADAINKDKYEAVPIQEHLASLNKKPTAEPTTETGADNKPQLVIPGAEKASDADMAQRRADAPLKPKVAQKDAGGLFSDAMDQKDLLDLSLNVEDNLITQHNLSASNLLFSQKMGGLAVPSLAISNVDYPLDGFGEITLLGEKDLVDPKKDNTTKVFDADVYSPRYPTLRYKIASPAMNKAWKRLGKSSEDLGHVLSSEIEHGEVERKGLEAFRDSSAVQLQFLRDTGRKIDLPQQKARSRYTELVPELQKVYVDSYSAKNEPEIKELVERAINLEIEQTRDAAPDLPVDELRSAYYDHAGDIRRSVIDSIVQENRIRREGGVDRYAARTVIRDAVQSHADEFASWVEKEFGQVISGETVANESASGNVRYLPHTLDNVVKIMRKKLQDGEGWNYGVGSIRSTVAHKFTSISGIKKARDRVISSDDMKAVKDEIDKDFMTLAERLQAISDNKSFGFLDNLCDHLKEVAQRNVNILNRYYPSISSDLKQDVVTFLDKLANLPTEYFEAKLQRAVPISDFKIAVIPTSSAPDVRKALSDAGLRVFEYDGTPKDRAKVTKRAAQEANLLFSANAPAGWDMADTGEPTPLLSETEQKRLAEIVLRTSGLNPEFVDRINVPANAPGLMAWGKGGEEGSTAAGFYANMRDAITLALDTAPARSDKVAYHESFHRLQNLFLTDKERNLLKANDAKLRKMIADRGEYSNDTVSRMSRKEVEAEAFGIWASGNDNAGLHIGIRKVWKNIRDMLARVRNYLTGRGYQTIEDVFGKAKSGEIAKRGEQEANAADREYSIVERAPDQPIKPRASVPTIPKPKIRFSDRLSIASKALAAKIKSKGGRYDRLTEGDEETLAELTTRKVLDYLDPVLKMQEKVGGNLNDYADAYLTARLAEGTIRHELHVADEKYVQPAIKELAQVGATEEDLHRYMYAMHAPERNRVVGLRNEEGSDLYKAATDPSIRGASGMSTNEARDVLSELAKDRQKLIGIRRAASHIRAMLDDGLKTQLRSGLINKATYERLTQQWQHYVPLRAESDQDGTAGGAMPKKSRGFDVRGDEFKGATGRYTKADNVVTYAINNAEQSIIRAEKNKAATAALRFINQFDPQGESIAKVYWSEDPDKLGDITKAPPVYKRTLDKDGKVTNVKVNAFQMKDDVLAAKVGGKTYYMQFADPKVGLALKKMTFGELGVAMKMVRTVSNWQSIINTRANPAFVPINMLRDIQTGATIALSKDFKVGEIASMVGNIPSAWGALWRDARGKAGNGKWDKIVADFKANGGKILFDQYNTVEETAKKLQKELRRETARGSVRSALRAWRGFIDLVESMNDTIENGMRVVIYDAAIKQGKTPKRAAFLARDMTVDFQKKGEITPHMNALYTFFNASVQGNTNFAKAVYKSRKVKIAMGALIMAGYAQHLINLGAGDDDDGENAYLKMLRNAPWEFERNIVIFIPGTKEYIKFPLGFGLNAFWHLGVQGGAVTTGDRGFLDATLDSTRVAFDAFNPLGSGGWVSMALPTIVDPVWELGTNENFSGNPIYPIENQYDPAPPPKSEQSFKQTAPVFKDVAELMNKWSGGNEVLPGAVDVYPDSLEYLWGWFTGGIGRFASQTVESAQRGVNMEFEPKKTPFVRSFYGEVDDAGKRSEYFSQREKVQFVKGKAKEFGEAGDEEALNDFIKANQRDYDAIDAFDATEKQRRRLNKQRRQIEKQKPEDAKSQLEEIDKQELELMNEARKVYFELSKP